MRALGAATPVFAKSNGHRNDGGRASDRSLWFEFDRATGSLLSAGHPAADRMEKAWTEPWPQNLVIVHFYGGHESLAMLTDGVGVAGLNDLNGVWADHTVEVRHADSDR